MWHNVHLQPHAIRRPYTVPNFHLDSHPHAHYHHPKLFLSRHPLSSGHSQRVMYAYLDPSRDHLQNAEQHGHALALANAQPCCYAELLCYPIYDRVKHTVPIVYTVGHRPPHAFSDGLTDQRADSHTYCHLL